MVCHLWSLWNRCDFLLSLLWICSKVVELFWNSSGAFPELFCHCSGIALEVIQRSSGFAPGVLRISSRVIELFGHCFGTVLILFWNSSNIVLDLFQLCLWISSRVLIELFSHCFGTVRNMFQNCCGINSTFLCNGSNSSRYTIVLKFISHQSGSDCWMFR